METGYTTITVRFEAPFWICLYERGDLESCQVCRHIFGAEPRDQEVYAFLLENWRRLKFSPPVPLEAPAGRTVSPKRARREARRQTRPSAMGTKAQQALALQRKQGKEARSRRSHAEREAEEARKFALRQEKRKEKHKGH